MASLRDRIRRLEAKGSQGHGEHVFQGDLAKQRQFRELFALIENARAELYNEPPPNIIEAGFATEEDIADGWKTHDWLRDSWTRAGGGRLTEEEEEFLAGMREELSQRQVP